MTDATPQRVWAGVLVVGAAVVAAEAVRYFLAAGSRGRFHLESRWFILAALCVVAGLARRQHPSASAPAPPKPWRRWLFPGCVGLCLLAFGPTLAIGYLSDDYVLLARARAGDAFAVRSGFWRPLPIVIVGLADRLAGPGLLHVLIVVLHGVNAALVAVIGRGLGLGLGASLAAAALFATFPASLEAVAWISGIQDVLMASAVLLGLVLWRSDGPVALRIAATLAAFAIGLLTKETAIAFPLLGIVLWTDRRRWREEAWVAAPVIALAGAYAIWRMSIGSLPADYAEAPTRFLAKELAVRTFGGLGLPIHADLAVPSVRITLGLFFPALLALNAAWWCRGDPRFVLAVRLAVCVLVSALPVYGYLFVSRDLQGSRYLYLPAVCWSLMIALLGESALRRVGVGDRFRSAVAVLVVASAILLLRLQLAPWLEAANMRDVVLPAAIRATAERGCGPGSTFEGVDSVRGAYVFRNGLVEAVPTTGVTPCRLRWDGARFVE